MRHFTFVVPPLAALAGIGLDALITALARWRAAAAARHRCCGCRIDRMDDGDVGAGCIRTSICSTIPWSADCRCGRS